MLAEDRVTEDDPTIEYRVAVTIDNILKERLEEVH